MFTVDSDSGAILLAGFLDYETADKYQITVQATDFGGLVSDPEQVDITVTDVAPEDNDTLHGGDGQDLLLGGDGHDILYGEEDADIFYFRDEDSGTDTIRDFDAAEGDRIDIAEFLEDYDAASDDIHDYIGTAQKGGDTYLNINPDGMGSDATTVAILEGVSTTLDDLLDGGNLVTV
uniref:Type I secretion C-terminal target domain (VC_A0849 subclass) n=1 Tax=Candidatus Kentrum sp. DK TaxID=2126562 RepID=A0A450SFJ0_9GAMM|nr:MAG: type I secretion C-terminal target domain (VC_A0849 subclass) [Candidatus Kentron sp. DK]